MPAPVPTAFNSLAGADRTSASVPIPSGVVDKSVVTIAIYLENTATITPPAGYTSKSRVVCTGSETHVLELFWHRASGAESANVTFTWSGSALSWVEAQSARHEGCIGSGDPFGATANTATSNSGSSSAVTPAVATLTPDRDNCEVLFYGTNFNAGANWTPPSGFTERNTDGMAITNGTLQQTTATATGSLTATATNSSFGRTGTVAYLLPHAQASGTVAEVESVAGAVTANFAGSGTSAWVESVSGNATIITPAQGSGTSPWVMTVSGNVTIAHYGVSGTIPIVESVSGAVVSKLLAAGTSPWVESVSGSPGAIFASSASGVSAWVESTSGSPIVTGHPDQGTTVPVLFDPDEVLTGGRVTYFSFDLLDQDENLIGSLYGVDAGDLTFDAYSAVKGTGKLTVYTDPQYRHLPDGQPDFLGAQINTPTGVTAAAVSNGTTGYLVASNAAALGFALGDRVQLTTAAGVLKETTVFTITGFTAGATTQIAFSPSAQATTATTDRLVAVTVSFTQVADWLNVRIRPMIRIARLGGGDDPDGRLVPAGVYLCAAPVENWTPTGLRRDVELIDKLSILDQDIASGDPSGQTAYSAATGANIITLVQGLIGETGETYQAIQPDSKVLPAPLLWDIGTTRLKVINDLLDAAGYFSLWVDGFGQYQATPYVQPSDRVPVYTSIAPFSDGPESLMDPAWKRDRDIYSVPNRYLVVSQGDGTTAALTSIVTNTDPLSPYSFAARGRWITQVEIGVEAVTQAALDTIARARLSTATSVTNQITLRHVFLPDLHVNSVVHFVNPDSGLDIYCYVVHTTIPLDPVKLCETTMRVVA